MKCFVKKNRNKKHKKYVLVVSARQSWTGKEKGHMTPTQSAGYICLWIY